MRKMQTTARGTEMRVVKKKIHGQPAETRHPPMKRPRICSEEGGQVRKRSELER